MNQSRWFGVLISIATLVACSSDDNTGPTDDGNTNSRKTGGAAEAVVGPSGGSIKGDGVAIEIPAGALPQDVSVAVYPMAEADIATLPPATAPGIEGTAQLSEVFVFTPHGTKFAVPITIELTHAGDGNAVLRLEDENDLTWELVDGTSFANGLARFQVTEFSIYAIARTQTTPCTPYASCAEALAASGHTCDPSAPNGCGGTMDCGTTVCGDGETCVLDSANAGTCRIPCSSPSSCPSSSSVCADNSTVRQTKWTCKQGYCESTQTDVECEIKQGGYCDSNTGACLEPKK